MTKQETYRARVGKAYICRDGLIRRIENFTSKRVFWLEWKEQKSDLWHYGGSMKAADFDALYDPQQEIEGPKPGEQYNLVAAFGGRIIKTFTIIEAE